MHITTYMLQVLYFFKQLKELKERALYGTFVVLDWLIIED